MRFIFVLVFTSVFMVQNLFSFSIDTINDSIKKEMITKEVWVKYCPVSIDRLRLISFSFYDFNGNIQKGELIVLDAVAPYVLKIVETLYEMKFPMETVNRIETYNLSGEYSNFEGLPIEHNNSSSFNCRPIKDTNIFSIHSYGLAIDINPKQNPYVIIKDPNSDEVKNRKPLESNIVLVQPFDGAYYLNRSNKRAGMITPNDDVVKLFYENGFIIWGGNWNYPMDTQHFQTTREMANLLAIMSSDHAEYFYDLYVKSNELKSSSNTKDIIISFTDYYKKDSKKIITYIKNNEKNFIENPKSIMNKYSK